MAICYKFIGRFPSTTFLTPNKILAAKDPQSLPFLATSGHSWLCDHIKDAFIPSLTTSWLNIASREKPWLVLCHYPVLSCVMLKWSVPRLRTLWVWATCNHILVNSKWIYQNSKSPSKLWTPPTFSKFWSIDMEEDWVSKLWGDICKSYICWRINI